MKDADDRTPMETVLDALDHPTPAARKAAEKPLTRSDTQGTGEDIQALTDRTLTPGVSIC